MRSLNTIHLDGYFILKSEAVVGATARTTRKLDAHYEAANIDQIISTCHNLNTKQKQQLRNLLEEFIDLFDGTLGSWKDQQINIELKENNKPYHAKVFVIPKSK